MFFDVLNTMILAEEMQHAAWPLWLAMLVWTLISTGIAYSISQLTQKDLDVNDVKPDDLNVTTTVEGTKYTVPFGTVWISNPVLAWWGDVEAVEIKDHYSVNKWFNNKRVYYTVGYHYLFGSHLIVCQGAVDGIIQMRNDDFIVWPDPDDKEQVGPDGTTTCVVNKPNLFGGRLEGGGIVGTFDFMYGEMTQLQNAYLVSVLGSDISASRGLTSVVLRKVNTGTSPYPKQWSFLVKRTEVLTDGTTQWYAAKSTVGVGLNAVHIIRECYTNPTWGFHESPWLFDETLWQAAADVIYAEGLGLSMKWEQDKQTLKQFVDDVCRHIDANVYREPETGKYIIKLVRADYTESTLDTFDDDDITSVYDFTRPTVFECANTFQLKYWSIFDNTSVAVTDHELALLDMQGGDEVPQELIYYGITDDDVAVSVLARDELEATCFPATMRIKGNRKLSALRPGSVFKLTWSPLGIVDRIIRVLNVDLGTLQNNTVTLKCMEDIFAMRTAIAAAPPTTGWIKPSSSPIDVDTVLVFETPFFDVYNELGDLTTALALDSHAAFITCVVAHPMANPTTRYRIVSWRYDAMVSDTVGGMFYQDGYSPYSPNAAILTDLPCDAVDVVVSLEDTDALSYFTLFYDQSSINDAYAIIDDEIFKIVDCDLSSTPPTLTLARGCLDTVPASHNGPNSAGYGARLWVVNKIAFRVSTEYTAGDTPQFKALPYTLLGNLAVGDASAWSAPAFNDRQARPYPPGDVKVNGASYPSTFTGDLVVTWAHRDRTQQLSEIVEHSHASIGPETGTTYTLEIYDENNVLIHTETGLTGTSYTYTEAHEMADCGFGTSDQLNTQLRFTLKSVRSGLDSWQSYDLTISRA